MQITEEETNKIVEECLSGERSVERNLQKISISRQLENTTNFPLISIDSYYKIYEKVFIKLKSDCSSLKSKNQNNSDLREYILFRKFCILFGFSQFQFLSLGIFVDVRRRAVEDLDFIQNTFKGVDMAQFANKISVGTAQNSFTNIVQINNLNFSNKFDDNTAIVEVRTKIKNNTWIHPERFFKVRRNGKLKESTYNLFKNIDLATKPSSDKHFPGYAVTNLIIRRFEIGLLSPFENYACNSSDFQIFTTNENRENGCQNCGGIVILFYASRYYSDKKSSDFIADSLMLRKGLKFGFLLTQGDIGNCGACDAHYYLSNLPKAVNNAKLLLFRSPNTSINRRNLFKQSNCGIHKFDNALFKYMEGLASPLPKPKNKKSLNRENFVGISTHQSIIVPPSTQDEKQFLTDFMNIGNNVNENVLQTNIVKDVVPTFHPSPNIVPNRPLIVPLQPTVNVQPNIPQLSSNLPILNQPMSSSNMDINKLLEFTMMMSMMNAINKPAQHYQPPLYPSYQQPVQANISDLLLRLLSQQQQQQPTVNPLQQLLINQLVSPQPVQQQQNFVPSNQSRRPLMNLFSPQQPQLSSVNPFQQLLVNQLFSTQPLQQQQNLVPLSQPLQPQQSNLLMLLQQMQQQKVQSQQQMNLVSPQPGAQNHQPNLQQPVQQPPNTVQANPPSQIIGKKRKRQEDKTNDDEKNPKK